MSLLAAWPIRHPGLMGEAEPRALLLVVLGRSALPTLSSQTSATHLTNSLCGATPVAISMGTLARKHWQENVEPPPDPQLTPAEAGFVHEGPWSEAQAGSLLCLLPTLWKCKGSSFPPFLVMTLVRWLIRDMNFA